jgi:hypothetical protein
LEDLYKHLFPEPYSLDLITVDDILRRYPLTGLGAPALAAIEQSQRIIRTRSDYSLAGSSEYHIGLIYLNWEDCRAAANQFSLARQPWSLANDSPAICLSHFAQGLALYHAYHNEAAMVQFSRAERLLKRPMVGAPGARMAALAEKMRPYLKAAQETLRMALWPVERPTGPVERATGPAESATAPTTATTPAPASARGEESTASEPPGDKAAGGSPRRVFDRPPRPSESQSGIPRPISNLHRADRLHSPVPGHVSTDERFGWYQIAEKRSEFLPAIGPGAWLLADREFDEQFTSREYVVVGSRRTGLGSIRVEPISHTSIAIPHCYFGYRVPDEREPSGARLYLDDTEKPVPHDDVLVLAVVEGYWNGLNGHVLPEP